MLDKLSASIGSRKGVKRVGRGLGSGHGRTACRGYKGQQSRTGGGVSARFEGGQTPLHRRLPKRGFVNIFRREHTVINVADLAALPEGIAEVTPQVLHSLGKIGHAEERVKVLGVGELNRALAVKAHAFSRKARETIEKAGGKAEVLPA